MTLPTGLAKSCPHPMAKTHDLKPAKGEGPIAVQIGPPGLQLINTKLSVPVKGKQVIWFAASLTFRTAK